MSVGPFLALATPEKLSTLDSFLTNRFAILMSITPLRWIALTWQGGLPQVCQSLGTKNPQAI
jgi:hypothetical protein